jgi:hypothetical protein
MAVANERRSQVATVAPDDLAAAIAWGERLTAPLPDDALAAIEARAAGAALWTPADCDLRTTADGEGYALQGATIGGTLIALGDTYEGSDTDWLFIAHAREDVPALLAALRTLRAKHAADVAAAVAAERERLQTELGELFTAARGTLATPTDAVMVALHDAGGCWLVSYDDDVTGDPITTIEYLNGARDLAAKDGDNPVRWVAVDRHGHACVPPRALAAPTGGGE